MGVYQSLKHPVAPCPSKNMTSGVDGQALNISICQTGINLCPVIPIIVGTKNSTTPCPVTPCPSKNMTAGVDGQRTNIWICQTGLCPVIPVIGGTKSSPITQPQTLTAAPAKICPPALMARE